MLHWKRNSLPEVFPKQTGVVPFWNCPNPVMVPTADPRHRGGEQIDLSFGVNFYRRGGLVKGHRVAMEFGAPIYQSLDGPQLETKWLLTVGWQYAR